MRFDVDPAHGVETALEFMQRVDRHTLAKTIEEVSESLESKA